MTKTQWIFGLGLGLSALSARALIQPEVETHCAGRRRPELSIEMNLIYERLHPMAGVHLFGLMRLARDGKTLSVFPVEAHPNYSEFTVFGSAAEPAQRMSRQSLRLVLQDSFLDVGKSTPAVLKVSTESQNPFGQAIEEEIEFDCRSVEPGSSVSAWSAF